MVYGIYLVFNGVFFIGLGENGGIPVAKALATFSADPAFGIKMYLPAKRTVNAAAAVLTLGIEMLDCTGWGGPSFARKFSLCIEMIHVAVEALGTAAYIFSFAVVV